MHILLHSCCGPCAGHCLRALREAGHEVTLFFSNANIAPPEEFDKRLAALRVLTETEQAPLVVDPPDHADWLKTVAAGFESAPEKGPRCARCFRYSLARAALARERGGFDAFTTTLTVSPHKVSSVIFSIGRELDEEHFLAIDFKKKNGFLDSIRLARGLGLYRQDYCGCEFSLAAARARRPRPEAPHA